MKLRDMIKRIPEKLAVMSPKKLILLAFVLSVLVASIIYIILTGFFAPRPAPAAAAPKYINVVVAAVDIPERTRITKDMLKTVSVPKEIVPDSAIRSTDDAVGKTAYTKILKEDVLTTQKISSIRAGFVGTIPPDTRAITIPMTDITGVAGFAKPGDYVDIFLISENKSYKNAIYGKIVVQNVLLLAVNKTAAAPDTYMEPTPATTTAGQENGGDNKNDKAKAQPAQAHPAAAGTVAMVTIAVAPSDVLKIEAALHEGTLYMALRPDSPTDEYALIPDYFKNIGGGDQQDKSEKQTAAAPQPAYVPPVYTPPSYAPSASVSVTPSEPEQQNVQVIRGNSVSSVNVR